MSELDIPMIPNKADDAYVTEYVVLSLSVNAECWLLESTRPARSAEAAIRDLLQGKNVVNGTYVAIPKRSWKPVSVKAQEAVTLKFEQAT